MKPKECNHKHYIYSVGICKLMNLPCGKVTHCPVENSEFRKILESLINKN